MKAQRINRLENFSIGLIYCLPALLFLISLGNFVYLAGSDYSDLTISHLPNLQYLRETLLDFRTIPLWSPAILGGYPFFANPLSGLWYPPGWPAVVWPDPWIFNLLAGLHLVFGAVGMGRFLKALGLGIEVQIIGGLAFGMMPKLAAHYAAGHITLVYAVVWTPWLLLSELRPLRGWVRPGVLLAIIFLADPRWAVYAGALWLAWSTVRAGGAAAWVRKAAPEAGIALLLSGPLLLPLIEYTRLSTRLNLSSSETLAFSLSPIGLIGLLTPVPSAEWQLYPGVLVLVFSTCAVLLPEVRRKTGFWLMVALASLLFAMGDSIPLLRLWASLPLVGVLRVPARAIFIFSFALLVLAAHTMDALASNRISAGGRVRLNLLIAAIAAIWLAGLIAGETAKALFPIAGLSLFFAYGLWRAVNRRSTRSVVVFGFILFFVLDLLFAAVSVITIRDRTQVYAESAEPARWLADQQEPFRVYSPSYSIPQHTAARYGLELAYGVDPLQLLSYADFMAAASGIPNAGYSIPLPRIDGDVGTANRDAVPDPLLLALLNVQYLAAEFELPVEWLELQEQFGETRIYVNLTPLSAVWRIGPDGDPEPVPPAVYVRGPNRIDLLLDRPGVYFISEVDYPGWRVTGAEPLPPYAGVFRTFEVESAGAQVSYILRPMSLYAGIVCFMVGVVIVIFRNRMRVGRRVGENL